MEISRQERFLGSMLVKEKVRKQDWVEENKSSFKAVSAKDSANAMGSSEGHVTASLSRDEREGPF